MNDTLTYSPYETYFFNQMRTGELSQDDYVTILHPLTVVSDKNSQKLFF